MFLKLHTGTGLRSWIRSGYCSKTYSAAFVPDSIAKVSSLCQVIRNKKGIIEDRGKIYYGKCLDD